MRIRDFLYTHLKKADFHERTLAFKLSSAAILVSSFALNANTQPKQNVTVIAVEYPPFTTALQESNGVAFELLRSALKQAPIELSADIVPPARAQRTIAQGDWCASFYPPKQGDLGSDFVPLGETIDITLVSATLQPNFKLYGGVPFTNKKVAVLRPSKEGELHQQLIQRGLELVFVESIYQGLEMLKKGRVNFAMGDKYSVASYQQNMDPTLEVALADAPLMSMPIGIFVNKDCETYSVLKLHLDAGN
ncbi:hypothetical protein AAEU32_05140 [Pseudoalteromonas sp. SSDWG2]|uniref:hypothetical protein n=1 Tax=Pseudoalteromonas sp. SSDWG2 TaxID=3139391 RepID=UPI003BAD476D